jgi:choline monooxygenase
MMVKSAWPLSESELARVTAEIATARGLPNAAYTHAQAYLTDRDAVMGKTWAGLLFADAVPARAYALPVEFMGLPLLVTRDRAGVIRVFHNVCSHRGVKLVDVPQEVNGLITCRYHAWSYACSGELKATPCIGGVGQNSVAGFEASLHGLKPVRCAIFMGIVFINLSGDAPEFDSHMAPLMQRASRLMGAEGFRELTPGRTDSQLILTVHCNWKLAVENYCEAYHLPWVHPELNSYSPLAEHYCFVDAQDFSGQGSSCYRLSDVAGTRLPRLAAWPVDRLQVAEYPALYPNVLLGFQADHAFAIILTPLGVDKTREELRIFYVGAGAESDAFKASRVATHAAWETVFAQDVEVVERMQLGRASPGYSGGVFSPVLDKPTHHFHCWVAKQLKQSLTAAQ